MNTLLQTLRARCALAGHALSRWPVFCNSSELAAWLAWVSWGVSI